VAQQFGTPRRTILLESAGVAAATPAVTPLEVEDTACWALLSATGLLARTGEENAPARIERRALHDVLRTAVRTTARGEVAAVTSKGRMVRIAVLDLPALPPTDGAPSLSGGIPVAELCSLEPGETVIALASMDPDAAPLALGTAQGIVKRVTPDHPGNRDAWDVVALKPGDSIVGAGSATDDAELVFVTSDAQLLRFSASAVRPQGRAAGGMAGVKLGAGVEAICFGVVTDLSDALVVTVAGTSSALPGTQPGSAKVTPLELYPAKGRGTGGVRAHRFIRGEDALLLAWVGAAPALATGSAGQPMPLPEPDLRRDGSGVPLAAPVHAVG